jgi:hypothetical protein
MTTLFEPLRSMMCASVDSTGSLDDECSRADIRPPLRSLQQTTAPRKHGLSYCCPCSFGFDVCLKTGGNESANARSAARARRHRRITRHAAPDKRDLQPWPQRWFTVGKEPLGLKITAANPGAIEPTLPGSGPAAKVTQAASQLTVKRAFSLLLSLRLHFRLHFLPTIAARQATVIITPMVGLSKCHDGAGCA